MKQVRLWSIDKGEGGVLKASDVPCVDNTDTEQNLEDLLVQSPHLLLDGLTLIGRQVPTEGGPLDLLGVDEDGNLTIYELKRGSLTRESVAQVLDYVSDVARMDVDQFAKLVEECSGKRGIQKFDDFQDWYGQTFPNRESVLETPPKAVLVGLGVDARALRIVNYLAKSGIQISLLTFNALKKDGSLFLARQVESVEPTRPSSGGGQTKEVLLQALRANAAQLGVGEFIHEVADAIQKKIPAYRWPGKTNYAFCFTGHTDQGRPTQRVYLNLALDFKKKGTLALVFQERAVRTLGDALEQFLKATKEHGNKTKYGQVEVPITKANWAAMAPALEPVLVKMVEGWKAETTSKEDAEDSQTEKTE